MKNNTKKKKVELLRQIINGEVASEILRPSVGYWFVQQNGIMTVAIKDVMQPVPDNDYRSYITDVLQPLHPGCDINTMVIF
jgi:hypothetical protein